MKNFVKKFLSSDPFTQPKQKFFFFFFFLNICWLPLMSMGKSGILACIMHYQAWIGTPNTKLE